MGWSGRGRGRGMGFNREMGFGPGLGLGRGFGQNMSFSCRWFPWLPRGWWRFPSSYRYGTPYSAPYPSTTSIPSFPQYPPMWPSSPMVQPGIIPPSQEREMLKQNLNVLENQLVEIRRRLSELETQE